MSLARPHTATLSAVAEELRENHQTSPHPPKAISSWSNLSAMPSWLHDLREQCACADPEAAKAAEWLLDNYFQVERAIRQIREDLPHAFYRRLVSLQGPDQRGLPRVYSLAHGLLEATHLQLSLSAAIEFTNAYQKTSSLSTAELWAFPTMLRLACFEILATAASSLFSALSPPFEPSATAAELESIDPTERFARALASLQIIAATPWKNFFDQTSHVEAILLHDPAKLYPKMDFETRDRYRKAVEAIARGARLSEPAVAEKIIETAASAHGDKRCGHVGYWLIDDGRLTVENLVDFHPTLSTVIGRWLLRHAGSLYAAAFVVVVGASLMVPALYLWRENASAIVWFIGVILTFIPATILSATIVNWASTLLAPPRLLPKLEFMNEIPAEYSTAVVMPVIVGSAKEAHAIIERLEMHWLTNANSGLRFVLLSDHTDAPCETTPADQRIEQLLVDGIRRLNSEHGVNGGGPFHLLHRCRSYNPGEDCWMAWERKRGKLEEFNNLVLTGDKGGFILEEGETRSLRSIRFVITVDADTILPMESARRLVGVIAHPLNQVEFDPVTGRVSAGYTVIQPRIEISPESGPSSHFLKYFAGDTAIDIYSRAVSDVYQDLFGSAVFVGKGIYEVRSFYRSLENRIPDNTLLSHDLFEGAHGRAALASDIVLYDGFPATYLDYVRRWHRWIRGDWQLLPWLTRQVSGANKIVRTNQLSLLNRWKILDNIRRSVIPLALVALVTTGWLVLPGSPWMWTFLTVLAPGAYLVTDLVTGLSRLRRPAATQNMMRQFANHTGRWALAVAFLLYEATTSLDAITRTLWRLFVSRRKLLEWTSAAHATEKYAATSGRLSTWRAMWTAPVLSLALTFALILSRPNALASAAPLLLLWFASPEIAIWISRRYKPKREQLNADARAFLRQVARKTWFFFEIFVGPDDNWLPPDNFQEDPEAKIGHRTSPTNIGMLFVSSLTAWDFGYLGSPDFGVRIENGLDTLDKLDRYRGHLLNWYDTRNLKPLEPRYVSTVDSGNIAICLITLKEGLLEAANAPALRANQWRGIGDTFDMLAGALAMSASKAAQGETLRSKISDLRERIDMAQRRPQKWRSTLIDLSEKLWPDLEEEIAQALRSPNTPSLQNLREINVWLERFNHDLNRLQWDFEFLFPWVSLTTAAPRPHAELANRIDDLLPPTMALIDAPKNCAEAAAFLNERMQSGKSRHTPEPWIDDLAAAIKRGSRRQKELRLRLLESARRAEAMAFEMDFRLLYDQEIKLFNIGYNVSSDRIDPHHYDLLATEARLASYFAIAKGDVPPEHWRHLGRPVTRHDGELSLLSWNGSMFEYLMPAIWLKNGEGTLLDQAEKTAVSVQQKYAEKLDVPWGVSESGFAARDAAQHYQYRAFGVPGLGMRRDLAQDIVIAPYASALALAAHPVAAVKNLQRLDKLSLLSHYGFFEAADYTPERARNRSFLTVRAFMAHHQGMILAAIGNALHTDILVNRFSKNMRMRTASLLLQERTPWELPPEPVLEEEPVLPKHESRTTPIYHSWKPQIDGTVKQMHLLGNGRLASWITESGGGAIWWRRHALTRWRPDPTCDADGLWVYVRDKDDDLMWSIGQQPSGVVSHDAHILFHPHMVEFHRRDNGVAIRMEVGVAAGDDLEIRLLTVTNETDRKRTLEFTSCGEVALAPPLDDERHPAFSKLFVGSEYLNDINGLLFTRRPQHPKEQPPTLLHRMVFDDNGPVMTSYEANRSAFLGRGGTARTPKGITHGLTNTCGWTLDPIMALQGQLEFAPRQQRRFALVTVAAGSPESVLEIVERYTTISSLEWALDDASREAAQEAHHLDLKPAQLPVAQSLSSLIFDPHPSLRAAPSARFANRLGQPRLWSLGISGDHPILLVHTDDTSDTDLLRSLVRAHDLWRRRLFRVDLVLMRLGASGYVEPVRERVLTLFREIGANEILGRDGGIHLVFADQISMEDKRLLECTASVMLDESKGALAPQLAAMRETHPRPPKFEPVGAFTPAPKSAAASEPLLEFENGIGGFFDHGREYVVHLRSGERTPAPWCNILANDQFGCLTTEAGGGFTWAVNSGENRLTPWTNDPVCDPPSEALYLRDEATAEIWTPTPAPAGDDAACQIHFGAGYTSWVKNSCGLTQELTIFVAPNEPVKFVRLRLQNAQDQARRITATYYAEWQLGTMRSTHRPHVICNYDAEHHALLARNRWNPEFGERVAFLASNRPSHSLTTDRRDFLGRNGDLSRPAGLRQWDLGNRINSAGDPCAAFQVHIDIPARGAAEVIFMLGQGADEDDVKSIIRKWRDPKELEGTLETVRAQWNDRLTTVQTKTPDPAFDIMVNRWLLYQTMSSRIMARAGFYQAGGAIGFRDQLQDVLALLIVDPTRARAHILECATRQFEEGDVLHWWHPPAGRGVRTRCSDDLLWLPYAAGQYVKATGDLSIMKEETPFLIASPLSPEEGDRYALFETSATSYPLFEHCARALERGMTKGPKGLPLIGAGDWNDGMNRVGARGRGESVWLAWFGIATMTGFADLADQLDRHHLANKWKKRADELRKTVNDVAWDGEWYVRAFDDEGHPWGSKSCDEDRIDSIAQSWSVLSGNTSEHARAAVQSAIRELVRDDQRLVRLLWPPIYETPRDPGYIKAYPPGIRENGGQYTHAAAWLGLALAELGDGDNAWRIFNIINPIRSTATRKSAERYRDEPYALAADVASVPPHVGRGGWSWYTGAAAWTWRLGIEGILGLRMQYGALEIKPSLPKSWGSAFAEIKKPGGVLSIQIEDPDRLGAGPVELTVNGEPTKGSIVDFPTDGSTHHICATIMRSQHAQHETVFTTSRT